MSLKIRLQRYGSRGAPHYDVVVMDSRKKRNGGKVCARVGRYVPGKDPSIVEIKEDLVAHWWKLGARPSDSVKNLFRISKIAF